MVILAAMVLLPIFDVVPIVAAVMMAAMAAIFTRCLSMEEAYRSVEWRAIFLIAGMLPLGLAMQQTGAANLIASQAPWALRPDDVAAVKVASPAETRRVPPRTRATVGRRSNERRGAG